MVYLVQRRVHWIIIDIAALGYNLCVLCVTDMTPWVAVDSKL